MVCRAIKNLEGLQKLVDAFPSDNCPKTDMFAAKDKMKAKMKVIESGLGVRQKFDMAEKPKMTY